MKRMIFPVVSFAVLLATALVNPTRAVAAEEEKCNRKVCFREIFLNLCESQPPGMGSAAHCIGSPLGLNCTSYFCD
jgi:hypothetical protein